MKSLLHFQNVRKLVETAGQSEFDALPFVGHIKTLKQAFSERFQQLSVKRISKEIFREST